MRDFALEGVMQGVAALRPFRGGFSAARGGDPLNHKNSPLPSRRRRLGAFGAVALNGDILGVGPIATL